MEQADNPSFMLDAVRREEATAAGLTRARQSERFISEASQGLIFSETTSPGAAVAQAGFRVLPPGPAKMAFSPHLSLRRRGEKI